MSSSMASGGAPCVSVVIPAFNAEADIEIAIRSAQAQTLSDLEVIVIDDASTDSTASLVEALAAQDSRITLLRNPANIGQAASRNRGLMAARGDWIAILDADDSFEPARLSVLLELGLNGEADIVSDNPLLWFPATGATRPAIPDSKLAVAHEMGFREFIDGCHYDGRAPRRSSYVFMHPMFRRAFMQRNGLLYDPRCRNGEDFILYLDCLAAGARWFITPETLYRYTVRDGSLTEVIRDTDRSLMIGKIVEVGKLPHVAADGALHRAVMRHHRLMREAHYYEIVKAHVKAGRAGDVLRLFRQDHAAPSIVGRELIARAPRIGRTFARRLTRKVTQFTSARLTSGR